ncbi:Histone H1 [Melia azedarach]|nr:Histone H1 [Melia azedarach]
MIQTAITELNEVGGSIEASISGYIEKNFEGLPWGHATFLRHHLRKLSRSGEIMRKNDGRYMIAVDQGREEEERRVERKEDDMLQEWNKEREKQVIVFGERCQVEKQAGGKKIEVSRQDAEATEQAVEGSSVLLSDEEKSNSEYQHIEMNEEPSHLQLQFKVSDKCALASVQQDLVIVEQSMPKEVLLEVIHEKNKFQEQLMENSHSLEGMGLPKRLIMVEEKKDDLRVEQQHQAKSPCTERATDVEVIEGEKHFQEHEDRFIREENQTHDRPEVMTEEEKKVELKVEQKQHTRSPRTERASDVEAVEGEKQLQEHHIEGETELLGLSCVNKKDLGKNSWVSLGGSSLPVFKRQRKQWQQLQQRKMSIWEENNVVIVCGLQAQQLAEPKIYAQQKAPNSSPDNKQ